MQKENMTSEREAFEKYWNPTGRAKTEMRRDEKGNYAENRTEEAWLIRQAARQDWPSENEAVEIMAKAAIERPMTIPRRVRKEGRSQKEPLTWGKCPQITRTRVLNDMKAAYRALLAATPKRQDWQPISTHYCVNKIVNVIIAVRHCETNEWLVGEAYLDSDGKWWWANEDTSANYAEPIQMTHGLPEYWQSMPLPPSPQANKGDK